MTLIPDLERDLVQAAGRAGCRRRRRTGLMAACGTAAAAMAAVVVLAVTKDSSEPASRPTPSTGPTPPARCALGETPPGARSWRRFDERPVRSLTVLGCARLDDGRQLELVVRKFRPRGRCLDVHVMGTASVSECAAGPPLEVPRHSIGVSSFTLPGTAASKRLGGALVVGWATGTIRRAELRPWDGGPGGTPQVALIRVTTVPLVLAAGEHTPFGVFVFKPAKDMRATRLSAFGPAGKELAIAPLPSALRR